MLLSLGGLPTLPAWCQYVLPSTPVASSTILSAGLKIEKKKKQLRSYIYTLNEESAGGHQVFTKIGCAVVARLQEEGNPEDRYILTSRGPYAQAMPCSAKRLDGKKGCTFQGGCNKDFSPNLRFLKPDSNAGDKLKHCLILSSPTLRANKDLEVYAYDGNKICMLRFQWNSGSLEYKLDDENQTVARTAVGSPILQNERNEMVVIGVLGLSIDGDWLPNLFVETP